MKVKVKAPYQMAIAHEGDVGIDVYAIEDVVLKRFETKVIPTGVYLELPQGVECQVRPKSGLTSKGVIVHLGTVDNLYRGEIGVNTTNLSENDILTISKGAKIAQLVFKKYENVEIIMVDEVDSNTGRGQDGFGSTGDSLRDC